MCLSWSMSHFFHQDSWKSVQLFCQTSDKQTNYFSFLSNYFPRLSQIYTKTPISCGSRAFGPRPFPATSPLGTWSPAACWLWPEPKRLSRALEVRHTAVVFTLVVAVTRFGPVSCQGSRRTLIYRRRHCAYVSVVQAANSNSVGNERRCRALTRESTRWSEARPSSHRWKHRGGGGVDKMDPRHKTNQSS